jgi:hypothetical protein
METILPGIQAQPTELQAIPIEIDRTYRLEIGCTCLWAMFLWCMTFVLVVKMVCGLLLEYVCK